MLVVKAPGLQLSFPSAWEEVTLAQFISLSQRMVSTDDTVEFSLRDALEALASDLATLYQLEASAEAGIIERLPFLTAIPDFQAMPLPARVVGVVPPQDLGMCTLIQKWRADAFLEQLRQSDQAVSYINASTRLLSIYLYPLLTNQCITAETDLSVIEPQILALPCTDALPLAAFFLTRFRSLTSCGQVSFQVVYPQHRKRKWLASWFRSWKTIRIMRFWKRSPTTGA